MTTVQLSDVMFEFFTVVVKLSAPILLISMLVGVIISIIQAATQIHEQTLTFVPKLIVIGLILMIMGDNMMVTLTDFTRYIVQLIAAG